MGVRWWRGWRRCPSFVSTGIRYLVCREASLRCVKMLTRIVGIFKVEVGGGYQLTVEMPRLTVPTNLRIDIVRAAIMC